MAQYAIQLELDGDRESLRRDLTASFLNELAGTTAESNYYTYIVYTGANNTNVELVRPTWLNKGFDFAICVSTCLFCSPKGRWSSRPSHIHLCRILTAMRQKHPDGFEHVRSGIRQAYACADFEAARLEAQKIGIDELDGIRGGMTGDIAIVVAKWMFIEQDITYWTHSGRAKFFGMLRDEGLL